MSPMNFDQAKQYALDRHREGIADGSLLPWADPHN